MAIQILIEDLTAKVNAGWKKAALAEHYGLPVTQMTKALQDAGLRIKKLHYPKYVLVATESSQVSSEEIAESSPEVAVEETAVPVVEAQTSDTTSAW